MIQGRLRYRLQPTTELVCHQKFFEYLDVLFTPG